MACHTISMRDEREFLSRMQERDPEIILKMVKCVLSAHKRKVKRINIFEVIFKDTSYLIFAMEKDEYKNFLGNCMDDLIKMEEYELCAEIKKLLSRNVRKKKETTDK